MVVWIKRVLQEWVFLMGAIITASFGANDVLDLFGSNDLLNRWLFVIAFVGFVIVIFWRLLTLQARIEERDRYKYAIAELTPHVVKGNQILEQCGRPQDAYDGAPMFFSQVCLPKIISWLRAVAVVVDQRAPEYIDKFENDGDIYHNTEQKAAAVQQLEGRLKRLGEILDDLRLGLRGG